MKASYKPGKLLFIALENKAVGLQSVQASIGLENS